MIVRRDHSIRSAFVLTPDVFVPFYESIQQQFPRLRIEASCADGATRSFDSIEELTGYTNPKGSAIDRLTVLDHTYNNSIRIEFYNHPGKNIEVSLSAQDPQIEAVDKSLLHLAESARPWYSFIANGKLFNAMALLSLGSLIVLQALSYLLQGRISFPENSGASLIKGGAIGLLLGYILTTFFPSGVFAFGLGKQRHEKNEIIRVAVILAFVVGTASTLFLKVFGV